jgi:UDP-glucose 4-epimerase
MPVRPHTVAGSRNELVIFGDDYNTPDGTCIRDYIHVVDLAMAHVKALAYLEKENNESFYSVFNVGTGNGHTVLEVIKSFERATGEKVNYRIGPRRAGDVEKVWANADKINRELNWNARLSLTQALIDAWNWQKELKNRGKK